MAFGLNTALVALLGLVPLGIGMALAVLAARALLKYIRSKDARQERAQVKRSLGEALRARRAARLCRSGSRAPPTPTRPTCWGLQSCTASLPRSF